MCVAAALAGTLVTRTAPQVFTVEGGPEAVTFDGAFLWVTSQFTDTVTKLNTDGFIVGAYKVGVRPTGIVSDGKSVWVSNQGSDSISRLDAIDGSIDDTFYLGEGHGPGALVLHGEYLWVANRTSNTVMKLLAASGELKTLGRTGTRPVGLAISTTRKGDATETFVWATNHQSRNITKIREADGVVAGTYRAGDGPLGVAFDGQHLWVSNYFSGNVMRFDLDGVLRGTYATGDGAGGLVVAGRSVWVANQGADTVTRLSAVDGELLETVKVGDAPAGVASDGRNLWVTSAGDDEIAKLADVIAATLVIRQHVTTPAQRTRAGEPPQFRRPPKHVASSPEEGAGDMLVDGSKTWIGDQGAGDDEVAKLADAIVETLVIRQHPTSHPRLALAGERPHFLRPPKNLPSSPRAPAVALLVQQLRRTPPPHSGNSPSRRSALASTQIHRPHGHVGFARGLRNLLFVTSSFSAGAQHEKDPST